MIAASRVVISRLLRDFFLNGGEQLTVTLHP
jgi:hypothetical protein